jgi:zinc/manganese transport system substrate-binding protein
MLGRLAGRGQPNTRTTSSPTPAALFRAPFRRLSLAAPLVAVAASGCGSYSGGSASASSSAGGSARIVAVGAENEYANVIAQVGGRYVKVSEVESNPNTDPHTYEASASVAQTVAGARLVVQNGAGYDTYMERIESASPSSSRRVIVVQRQLGLPGSTPNPHLWYKPTTMPAVARAIAADLSALQPADAAYFQANASAFTASLQPWFAALRRFSHRYPNTTVASTEPVADYMLEAAGIKNLTPFSMQADIMNGTDPAPQDVSLEEALFAGHTAKALVHNEQVTSSLTEAFVNDAKRNGVPVVGVYETMPTPGYDYQSWMLAELGAIEKALARGASTEKL